MIIIAVENYRRFYKYTQKEFADLIGKERQTYILKEQGKIKFSPREMRIIRDELKKHDSSLTVDTIFFT